MNADLLHTVLSHGYSLWLPLDTSKPYVLSFPSGALARVQLVKAYLDARSPLIPSLPENRTTCDYLLAYCSETRSTWLIPLADLANQKSLRLGPASACWELGGLATASPRAISESGPSPVDTIKQLLTGNGSQT